MALKLAVFFSKKIRRIAQRLKASPPGPPTCHHVQNIKKVQNVIQIALKWLFIFFRKKIARIAQQLEASPPGRHTCHHVQNVKNVQNVIQMALKCLLFCEKIEELPSGWELASIVEASSLAHNLDNQLLSKSLLQGF